MRRTMTAVGLGLAMTAALAACGDEKDAGADATAEETSASAAEESESESASDSAPTEGSSAADESTETAAPVVTVIDAGEGPGELLELDLEEGHHETTVMRMKQTMTISGMPGQDVPEMSFTIGTSIVDVTDEGYVVETAYEDVAIDAEGQPRDMVRTLEESLSVVEGLTGTTTFARNGAVLENELDIPADADPMLASIIEQMANQAGSMTVPLPEEPVGPGAVWEARTTLELSGLSTAQATTYTLEAIDGDELELSLVVEQTMRPGTIAGGAELISGSSSMTSTSTLSLSQLMPVTSAAEGTSEMVMDAMGREMTMDMVLRLDVTSTVD